MMKIQTVDGSGDKYLVEFTRNEVIDLISTYPALCGNYYSAIITGAKFKGFFLYDDSNYLISALKGNVKQDYFEKNL